MVITVKLTASAAANAVLESRGRADDTSRSIDNGASRYGVALTPLYPAIDDPELSTYFTAEVPDTATAERTVETLRKLPEVEAAYTKPEDQPAQP